jgi:hypothetical protein
MAFSAPPPPVTLVPNVPRRRFLDRGYGRPAQSLDLHLSADAITKRLSDMTDAELATLEQRMIAAAPIVQEATAEVSEAS